MAIVDTAALAVHLACSPGHVRRLAKKGFIPSLGREPRGGRGRPAMWFDTDAVDDALAKRRAEKLDQGQGQVRK